MSKSKYITFFKLCLFSIMLISNAFARQEIIDYETFVHLDKKNKYKVIKLMQLHQISTEVATKKEIQYKTSSYTVPLINLIKSAHAQVGKFDKNKNECIFAGWPSIVKNRNGVALCVHPNNIKKVVDGMKNLSAAEKTLFKSHAQNYEDQAKKSQGDDGDCVGNTHVTVCNPDLFGVSPEANNPPICISGVNKNTKLNYNNISYQCFKKVQEYENADDGSNPVIDKLIQRIENGTSEDQEMFRNQLMKMYDICMCKGESDKAGINQDYVDRIYIHRTCYGLLMQTKGILNSLNRLDCSYLDSEEYHSDSAVTTMRQLADTMYNHIENQFSLSSDINTIEGFFEKNDINTFDPEFQERREEQLDNYRSDKTCPIGLAYQLGLTGSRYEKKPGYWILTPTISGTAIQRQGFKWFNLPNDVTEVHSDGISRIVPQRSESYEVTIKLGNLVPATKTIEALGDQPSITIEAEPDKTNRNKYIIHAKPINFTNFDLINWHLDGLPNESDNPIFASIELTKEKPNVNIKAVLNIPTSEFVKYNITNGKSLESNTIPLKFNDQAIVTLTEESSNSESGSSILMATVSNYEKIDELTPSDYDLTVTDKKGIAVQAEMIMPANNNNVTFKLNHNSSSDYPYTASVAVTVAKGLGDNGSDKITSESITIDSGPSLVVTNFKIEGEEAYTVKIELNGTSEEIKKGKTDLTFSNEAGEVLDLSSEETEVAGEFTVITKDQTQSIKDQTQSIKDQTQSIKVKAVYSLEGDEKLEGETTIEITAPVPDAYTLVLDASEPVDKVVTITAEITKDGKKLEEDSDDYKTLIGNIKWFGTDGIPTGETEAEDEIKETTENSDEETTGSGSGSGSGAVATSEGKKSGQASIEIEQKVNLKYEIKAKIPEAKKSDPISVDALDPPIPDPTIEGIEIKITKTTDGERTSAYSAKLTDNDGEIVAKPDGAEIIWIKKSSTSSSESSSDDEESSKDSDSNAEEGDTTPLDTESSDDDSEESESIKVGSGKEITISKNQTEYKIQAFLKLEGDKSISNEITHGTYEEKTPARRGGGMNPMLKQTPPAPQLIQKGKNTIHQGWD